MKERVCVESPAPIGWEKAKTWKRIGFKKVISDGVLYQAGADYKKFTV
jgi:hypothetical protein